MEGKGRICSGILTAFAAALTGCMPVPAPALQTIDVVCSFDAGGMHTRALDPDEELISDVSLLIFDSDGHAEECIWLPEAGDGAAVRLVKGNTYNVRNGIRNTYTYAYRVSYSNCNINTYRYAYRVPFSNCNINPYRYTNRYTYTHAYRYTNRYTYSNT
jgi:hypothetical protein